MNGYQKQLQVLGGCTSKKVANNTYVQMRDGVENNHPIRLIVLKYHATDIVRYYADGRIVLDTGGWRTSTTKLRFNESYAQLPFGRIYADRGVWYVHISGNWQTPESMVVVPYADGLTFVYDAATGDYSVDTTTCGKDPKATQKLRKRVKDYASKYVAALRAGKVPAPSNGDCMFCNAGMTTADGQTLGEASKDKGHIMSHLAERYYVPSLILRAVETMPSAPIHKMALAEAWNAPQTPERKLMGKIGGNMVGQDFVWIDLGKILGKYLLRQLGEMS